MFLHETDFQPHMVSLKTYSATWKDFLSPDILLDEVFFLLLPVRLHRRSYFKKKKKSMFV